MLAFLRKFRTLAGVYHAHMMEWRTEILLWMLASTFPFIMMAVWVEAGRSGAFELSAAQFAQYFIAVFIVRQFTVVWVIYVFEQEVVTGQLSPFLLQPIDPAWRHVARHSMERVTRLPFLTVLLIAVFLIVPETRFTPQVTALLQFALVVTLAFAVRFIMQYTFALLAFWTERASSVENLWFLVYLFLSGMLAPLDVYPPAVRTVAEWTPFPYMIHYPAKVLLGAEGARFGWTVMMLVGWFIVFFAINRWLWRVALRRYSAMGA